MPPLPDKSAEQAEAEEELLVRLVELNKQRAQEESQGIVRWLRPDYQAPDAVQQEAEVVATEIIAKPETPASKGKVVFPKNIPEQLRVLRKELAQRLPCSIASTSVNTGNSCPLSLALLP